MDTIISLALLVAMIAGMWKIYEKAGVEGWKSLVPFYNMWVWLEITDRPKWWLAVLFLVPFGNFVIAIMMLNDMCKCFGKGTGFLIGAIFLPFIFLPMLGFDKSAVFHRRVASTEPALPIA